MIVQDSQPGGRLDDRYLLQAQVGEGGMGAVFRSLDERTGRTVAIKIIREAISGDGRLRRLFNREVRAVARLDHPGVVRVLDYGANQAGRPYYVMEFVSGVSLAQLPVAAFSWADIRFIIEALLRTLAYAHARGVVHRDLKPENILITAVPRRAIKLVDFGIAKLSEELEAGTVMTLDPDSLASGSGSGSTAIGGHPITGSWSWPDIRQGASPMGSTLIGGNAVGTPAYMAPEQAQGLAALVGPAADLYAVGCLIYELVSGRPPFQGPTPMATIVQRLTEPPPPLTRRDGGPVPQALDDLARLLLTRPLWKRPASAADVRARLLTVPDFDPDGPGDPSVVEDPVFRHTLTGNADAGHTLVDDTPPPLVPPTSGELTPPERPADAVFRLLALRPPPLVGRSKERQWLFDRAADLLAVGGTRALFVRGRRGMGRRRLARWLREVLAERGLYRPLFVTYRVENGLEGTGELRVALARALGLDPRRPESVEDAASRLAEEANGEVNAEALSRARMALSRYFLGTVPEEGAGGAEALRLHLRLDALLEVLDLVRLGKPLLISVDELHWADLKAFEVLLDHLGRTDEERSWPLLLLCTVADDEGHSDTADVAMDRLVERPEVDALTVGRLSDPDARMLLHSMLPLRPEAVEALVSWSEGVPRRIVRGVRSLGRRGDLSETGGVYWLRPEAEARLPALMGSQASTTILEVEGPDAEARLAAIHGAAILGSSLELDRLHALMEATGGPQGPALDAAVEAWIADGVLVEADESPLRFDALPVMEAARQAAEAREEGQTWHRVAAESLMADGGPERAAAIGRHLHSAGDARAPAWLLEGATRALASGYAAFAGDLFTLAEAALVNHPPKAPERGALAVGLARLAVQRFDRALYDRAMVMLTPLKTAEPLAAWAARVEGQWALGHGDLRGAERALGEAVELFESLGETEEALGVREILADVLRRRGQYKASAQALLVALGQAAARGLTAMVARLTLIQAFIDLETESYTEALAKAEAVLRGGVVVERPWLEAQALRIRCGAFLRLGRPGAAVEAGEAALALTRRIGDRGSEMALLNLMSMCHLDDGRPGPARALAREALELSETLDEQALKGRILNNLALACLQLGREGEADRAFKRAIYWSWSTDDPQNEARVCVNLAEWWARQVDEDAVAFALRAVEILTRINLPFRAAAEALVGRLQVRFGRETVARVRAEWIERRAAAYRRCDVVLSPEDP